MKRVELDRFLEKVSDQRVMVVGDLMLDEYLWGNVERISPEAPVQVVDIVREDIRLGGAGNVINNLIGLGAQVIVASVLGDDGDAMRLRERLAQRGVDAGGIIFEMQRKTSRKTRVLASNQNVVRIDRESRAPILPESEEALLEFICSRLDCVDVMLLSDYLKGVLTPTLLAKLIPMARKQKVPVIVDPKGIDFNKYRGATLLTPNRKEAQLASGVNFVTEQDLLDTGERFVRELELDSLVLTRSEEGMSLFTKTGEPVHLPTQAHEIYDVSGAGDTVLALLGLGLGSGLSLEDAASLANVAAGIVVGKVGTSTISVEEVRQHFAGELLESDFKVKSRSDLIEKLAEERSRGRKVVFTNGCFDLLHAGHVRYLQKARQLGDLLVLGLNSDASIRRLKGDKRPLLGEVERAQILAALDCIDYLVIFDEDTPLELIRVLQPDVLAKGADYQVDEVVGKDLVESYGGRVELVQFVEGKSTTNIINEILSRYRDDD
jgi:D-beta-D-heptose 7-phosphate kinase/D-beta-D-heptose 1-phosphate adenosyltransferase